MAFFDKMATLTFLLQKKYLTFTKIQFFRNIAIV